MLKELPQETVNRLFEVGRQDAVWRWQARRAKEDFAESLRAAMTPHERTMAEFLGTRPKGWRFKPQVVVCGYILDFYCATAKTAIECDGARHDEDADARRDGHLWSRKGIQTLRFTNDEIEDAFDDVAARIIRYLPDPKPRTRKPTGS